MCETQAWVTFARDDDESWSCILLSRSLKRVFTRRKVYIAITQNVTAKIRNILQWNFDAVICVDGEAGVEEGLDTISQIYRLANIIFLDCNCVCVSNADDLFRNEKLWSGIVEKNVGNISQNGPSSHRYYVFSLGRLHENPNICLDVNLQRVSGHNVKVTGTEWKFICFSNVHPLYAIIKNENPYSGVEGTIENAIISFCTELAQNLENKEEPGFFSGAENSIAVVGLSCRFPGANNLSELWSMLLEGREGIQKVPPARWNRDRVKANVDNTLDTEAGFLSCPVDHFDGKFFQSNPADLSVMDPQQRLALQLVWEALEHAGMDPDILRNSLTGVFGGWWRQDYKELLHQQGVGFNESDFFRAHMGNSLGTMTARISHFFQLIGPSIATESGCSTSIVGVDMACSSLKDETSSVSLAVAANLMIHPYNINMMNNIISMDGRCKTFDINADGFGRSEAVGVLVLKRLPDAIRDKDTIWGVIRGSAVVQEGLSKSMGTPTVECEALAMRLALNRAGVAPKDVDFVETHGTGTPVGDPLEIQSVHRAYSPGRGEGDVLTVGSVKTNLGHTESVSGIAGIIKTLLCMKYELIPVHRNLKSINPEIQFTLDRIPAQLPLTEGGLPWPRREGGTPRLAGVSSFGITGTDAHVIIQEPPLKYQDKTFGTALSLLVAPRKVHLFTVSSKTEESFLPQMEAFLQVVNSSRKGDFANVEFTQHIARSHFPFRRAFLSSRVVAEVEDALKSKPKSVPTSAPPKLCFVFTGQGSQYKGMAQTLYNQNLVFRTHFDECLSILGEHYGLVTLKEAMGWGENSSETSHLDINRTLFGQIAIFCVEYGLVKLWESWGITPSVVVGHSLGEFCAAVVAGMMDLKDALKLIVERAFLVETLPGKSGMVAIALDLQGAITLKDGLELDVAAVNTGEQTVLAGGSEAVERFVHLCNQRGIKSHLLSSSHGFHSRCMDPILQSYEKVAPTVKYSKPKDTISYVSGLLGKSIHEVDSTYWVRQLRDPVQFLEASRAVLDLELGKDVAFVEIGPHPVLTGMIATNSELLDKTFSIWTMLPSLRKNVDDWEVILSSLGKLYCLNYPINWQGLHCYSPCTRAELPGYQFDTTETHWLAIRDDGTTPFHPLLGANFPTPGENKIFKNELNPGRIPFLQDHVLGNRMIFPGAAYVEMFIAAAIASKTSTQTLTISSPVILKNFCIESPICMHEKNSTEIQTLIATPQKGSSMGTSEEISTAIYTKVYLDQSNWKWIRHAETTLGPSSVDIAPVELNRILSTCTLPVTSSYDYKSIDNYGYKFGQSFRLLTSARKSAVGDEFLFEFESSEQPNKLRQYLIHPCIIDTMFQAQVVRSGYIKQQKEQEEKEESSLEKNIKTLLVPIQIEEFVCWQSLHTGKGYVYVVGEQHKTVVDLFDAEGQLVARMSGTEFLETTLSNIAAMVDSQTNPYPAMYSTVWRDAVGPCERRIDDDARGTIDFSQMDQEDSGFDEREQEFYDDADAVYALYMVKALVDLGIGRFCAKIGDEIEWPEIAEELQVVPGLQKFLRYILFVMVEDCWLEKIRLDGERIKFKVKKTFPEEPAEVVQTLQETKSQIIQRKIGIVDINCVETLGDNLSRILSGQVSALSILFPDGTSIKGPAEEFYADSFFADRCTSVFENVDGPLNSMFELPCAGGNNAKPIVRILEIGAGTGSMTKKLLNILRRNHSRLEYTYTDISAAFWPRGQALFEGLDVTVKYQTLDIEKDPIAAGFIPGHYDIVFAGYVIHATKRIEDSVRNMKKLLKPWGILAMLELTEPHRQINLLFGGLEQFWNFEDFDDRPYGCELDRDGWTRVLERNGFQRPSISSAFNGRSAGIFAKLLPENLQNVENLLENKRPVWVIFGREECPLTREALQWLGILERKTVLVTEATMPIVKEEEICQLLTAAFSLEEGNCTQDGNGIVYLWGYDVTSLTQSWSRICEPYLHICKFLSGLDTDHVGIRMVAYTRKNLNVNPTDFQPWAPHSSPLFGMTKALINESHGSNTNFKCVDLDLDTGPEGILIAIREALSELFTVDNESLVAYRGRRRYVERNILHIPKPTGNLTIPTSPRYQMVLSPPKIISDLEFTSSITEVVGVGEEQEIEVEVKAYALNFLDVLMVLKPDPVFDKFSSVGLDFAGVVTSISGNCERIKVGERVMGARQGGIGPAMPSHIRIKENRVIKIPRNLTFSDASTLPVAFTTAAMALLEVAKIKQGEVVLIHTGSGGVGLMAIFLAKREKCVVIATAGNERKRKYLRDLGVEHVFNSRTTRYEHEIRAVLSKGERKTVDVVLNSLTGAGFKEATLSLCGKAARFIEISKMNVFTKEDVYKMRPDVYYEIVDLASASETEISNQHQKIKAMLETEDSNVRVRPLPYVRFSLGEIRQALEYMQMAKHIGKIVVTMPVLNPGKGLMEPRLFNENGTYLITGGLGGIGMEVVKYLISSGARYMLCLGRTRNLERELRLRGIRSGDEVNIAIRYADVGSLEDCERLFADIENGKVEENGQVFPPLRGIMHVAGQLSDGTYEKQSWEKYEAVFRSKVEGTWNLHQLTRKLDLPLECFVCFSSIAAPLGSLAQSNYAAANYFMDCLVHFRNASGLPGTTINWGQWGQVGVADNLNIPVLSPFTPQQGIAALDYILRTNHTQLMVSIFDSALVKKMFPISKQLFCEIEDTNRHLDLDGEEFWNEYDAAGTRHEKIEVVKKYIKGLVRIHLRMDKNEEIDDHLSFSDMGMDSLMMVEMKNGLQNSVGKRIKISIAAVKDCKTVSMLAQRLVGLIYGNEPLREPTREELKEIILQDSILHQDINVPTDLSTSFDLADITTVLVTGPSGMLGPYVVRQLLKRPDIRKVYCLLRPHGTISSMDRFKRICSDKGLLAEMDLTRVECLTGDVTLSNFGLISEHYSNLASEVQAVFNLAAKISYDEFYVDSIDNLHSRMVNVKGLENTLRFAVHKKLKAVYHASTLLACTLLDESGYSWEEWPVEGEFDEQANSAYPISKYVCDRLIAQAVERGIPCKAFRFPYLAGAMEGNRNFNAMENILMMKVLSYMKLGFMPGVNIPSSILPVDTCAELSVSLFFNKNTGWEIFNVANPKLFDEMEFSQMASEFGVHVDLVPLQEFYERARKLEAGDKVNQMVGFALTKQKSYDQMEQNLPECYKQWMLGQIKDFVFSRKLAKFIPHLYPIKMATSKEILRRELLHAKDSGVFMKMGINVGEGWKLHGQEVSRGVDLHTRT